MEGFVLETGNAEEGYCFGLRAVSSEKSYIAVAGFALGEDFVHFITSNPVILMFEVRVKRRLVDGVRDHEDVWYCGFAASDGELALIDSHLELWTADFTSLFR